MEQAIRDFPKQFEWEPVIRNADALVRKESTIVAGMGGSAWPAEIIQALRPMLDIVVQRDYEFSGIPETVLQNSLVIASSYSGNTEEPISVFKKALERKLPLCAITTGGKLLDLAKENSVPYVEIKNTGIQPRMAKGFMVRGLLKLMGEEETLAETSKLATLLQSYEAEEQGKELAHQLKGKIPMIYASTQNKAIAYVWKITFNETAKIPALYNVFPELNHNEMTGFDVQPVTKSLSEDFLCILLRDTDDYSKITKRMDVLKTLYENRNLSVRDIELKGSSRMEKIFSSLFLADWAAYYTAKEYGVEPEQVPMVEEFKRLML